MKKPFYSKHNRKFCVVRRFDCNEPVLTKKDCLCAIFNHIGIPFVGYSILITRYKNKFNLSVIKDALQLVKGLDRDYLEPWPNNNPLLLDLGEVMTSSAFKNYCINKVGIL